jgi:hypothetical protein
MTTTTSDTMKRAICKDCGKRKLVYRDTGLCDDCEEYYVYCSVCDEQHHEDDLCRHLFWDRKEGWWAGPGADDPCYNNIDKYKASVLFALHQLQPSVLEDLRICLHNGTLQFCLCGTTFGVDGIEFHGQDDAGEVIYCQNIVENMHGKVYDEWNEEQTHQFEAGFEWLMALDEKTPREKQAVLEWIAVITKGG